jgi:hypothetical protein
MNGKPEWLQTATSVIGRFITCVIVSYIAFRIGGLVGMVLSTPIWGVLFAKVVMDLCIWCYQTASQAPIKKYNGNYYEFAHTQIRVFVVANRLWCVDKDVLKVIGEKPNVMLESLFTATEYDRITDTKFNGFSEAGLEKLLQKSTHFEALRMLHWFQREVQKQHYRKLEVASEIKNKKPVDALK